METNFGKGSAAMTANKSDLRNFKTVGRMCNRNEIVTNGCSGACCEKFTLPVAMGDLHRMKAEHVRVKEYRARLLNNKHIENSEQDPLLNNQMIKCDNGAGRLPVFEEELDKLIEMLIPLGTTDIDPQSGKPISDIYGYDPERHSEEMVHRKTHGHFKLRDGKMLAYIFTCKHFDTVNRICTNYENRPEMCKMFGSSCAYTGCGFAQKLKEAEEKALRDYEPLRVESLENSNKKLVTAI